LSISGACPLILPSHIALDQAWETSKGANKLGTTGRGIGPAYEDKVARRGIRLAETLNEQQFAEKLTQLLKYHNFLLQYYYEAEPVDFQKTLNDSMALAEQVRPMISDTIDILHSHRKEGDNILFEGAQGSLFDIDHGTYPYVTSSNTTAGATATGSGYGPLYLDYVLGITKAYTTRVGEGPFPTEQDNEIGGSLGERGHEFGTVTGRARRCGWFDAVLVRQAIRLGGIGGIALTKLDVLDGFDELKVCIGYRIDGKMIDHLPASPRLQASVEPVYESFEGWHESTQGARSWAALPATAVKYVRRIEELIGAPVTLLSTSPERDDTILMSDPFAD